MYYEIFVAYYCVQLVLKVDEGEQNVKEHLLKGLLVNAGKSQLRENWKTTGVLMNLSHPPTK